MLLAGTSHADLSTNPPSVNLTSPAANTSLPVSYDLRKLGRVTPIRNQESWGTCWAFAAMSSVESNYLSRLQKGEVSGKLGNAETLDLSELHLAWYIRNHPQKDSRFALIKHHDTEHHLQSIESGFSSFNLTLFASLAGPVLEESLPYLSNQAISNDAGYSPQEFSLLKQLDALPSYMEFLALSYMRSGKDLLPGVSALPENYGVVLRMTDALFATPAPTVGVKQRTDIPDGDAAKSPNTDYVKRLLMEHGALEIAYHSEGGKADYLNAEHNAYRYGGSDQKVHNHAVVLVGWDDNFSRMNFNENYRPEINGAWLVRNNWGENFADGGYFWMSYEQSFEDGIAQIVEEMPENLSCYQYDSLGACNAYSMGDSKEIWTANTFRITTAGEEVESIAFYTTVHNASVEWDIYLLGEERDDEAPYHIGAVPSRSGTATFPYAGYHTVKLTELLPVAKGNYFSVVLHITNSEHAFPAAVEMRVEGYSDTVNVHDGESWFSADGIEWWDGVESMTYIGNDRTTLHHVPMNACIKAFTQDFDLSDNDSASADNVPVTILGIPLRNYAETFDASRVNTGINSLPLETAAICVPSDSSITRTLSKDTQITYYLVNRNMDHATVTTYTPASEYGLLQLSEKIELEPLFLPGYEPDEFWREKGLEFPVYGPFTATVEDKGNVFVDVGKLSYADGSKGAVPEGHYSFIYDALDGTHGSISVMLRATELETQTASDGGSSSGCDVGLSLDGLAVIWGLAVLFRKH